mgnify:FL=1
MELAQWRLRREGTVLVGAFGRMRMGKLVDDAARVVVTLEGIHVGEAWEGRGRRGEHLHALRGRLAPITALSGTIRMQSACNPMRWPSACNPRAIRMQSEGHPSQSPLSRFESQTSRNQSQSVAIRRNPSQSVAISRNQSQSVAITCEPVDSNPSRALLPRPRAVPGIPTVLLRELLGELELAPDEGRNKSQSVAISRNQENLNSHLMRGAISRNQSQSVAIRRT